MGQAAQASRKPVSSQQATLGLNRIFVFKNSGCIPRYLHTHVCLYSVMQQGHRKLALFHHYSVRTFLYCIHLFLEFLQWWLLDDTCISCTGSTWEKQNKYLYINPNPIWKKRGQFSHILVCHRLGFIKTLKWIALTEPLDVGLNSGHRSRSNCVLVLQGLDHLTSIVAVSIIMEKKTCMFYQLTWVLVKTSQPITIHVNKYMLANM